MKTNKFIQSTLLLVIGGMITRFLGFVIRIIYTRMMGVDGVGLYTLVFPTYSLLITIASLALPIAISKLVAEERYRTKTIFLSSSFIMIFVNGITIFLVVLFAPYIANVLLKKPEAYYLLICMALTLPFISISSILKGYFYGKQKMMPQIASNVAEQVARLVMIVFLMPSLIKISIKAAVAGLILLNVIAELAQSIVLLISLPKGVKIKKSEIRPNMKLAKNVLGVSIPSVSSRLIGNIGFFFEPIILTNLLLYSGYASTYIVSEYGAYNAYAVALLTMPSFFIQAISTSLLPEISKFQALRNKEMIRRRFIQAMRICIIFGLFFSTVFYFYGEVLLKIIYNTTAGSSYLKILAPFFVLFYLEGPLISTLQAVGLAHKSMQVTLSGVLIKLVVLSILSLCKIGVYSLVIAEIVNILYVVLANFLAVKRRVLNS